MKVFTVFLGFWGFFRLPVCQFPKPDPWHIPMFVYENGSKFEQDNFPKEYPDLFTSF